jgi:hypothetical protein
VVFWKKHENDICNTLIFNRLNLSAIALVFNPWIQVINAIPEFMQLCVQLVQKTPHEVFGNLTLFEGGG